MGDVSGGNVYMNNHTLSQQSCDNRNSDVSSGNNFINSHTLSQCDYSSAIKEMDVNVFIWVKTNILIIFLQSLVHDKIKLYRYILCVTFFSVCYSVLFVNHQFCEFYRLLLFTRHHSVKSDQFMR